MFRLYCGIVRDKKWFNYAEVKPLQGGVLAMLDGGEKTGASRILNLMKGSVDTLFTESGDEYKLNQNDYESFRVHDTWKIGYEQIKLKTGEKYPVIPENFFCGRCSQPKKERYTKLEESWEKLIEEGYIDEFFLESPEFTFDVELPIPIEFPATKTFMGGTFDTLKLQHITLGDMIKIHRNPDAMENEANIIRATWDASIIGVKGMGESDFNRFMRVPGQSFSKNYLSEDENQVALQMAIEKNVVGIDASRREIYCSNCGERLASELDFTNFFSPLLPKKLSPR